MLSENQIMEDRELKNEKKVKVRQRDRKPETREPAYTRDTLHEKLSLGQSNLEEPERWDGMS